MAQDIKRIGIIRTLYRAFATWIIRITVTLGTLPYYRFFYQNTLSPILHITECVKHNGQRSKLVILLSRWRKRKLYELHYIQIASTILAAAVIGCFSWAPVDNGHWIGPAVWYCSLVLSIFAILLSSSQAFIFNGLAPPSSDRKSSGYYWKYLALIIRDAVKIEQQNSIGVYQECTPRWKMVFVWQSSMMLMAYAVVFFLIGLTLYVCTPLFNGERSTAGAKTSIFYLVVSGFAGAMFVYCSFWAYRFIDLDEVIDTSHSDEASLSSYLNSNPHTMKDINMTQIEPSSTQMEQSHVKRQIQTVTDEV